MVFLTPWVEYVHVPDGGTIFLFDTVDTCLIDSLLAFDTQGDSEGHTSSSWVKFTGAGAGGNQARGSVHGRGTTRPIAYGVILEQSRNSVSGVRRYRDHNVLLAPGVEYCSVVMDGSEAGAPGWGGPSVVDNSGNATNVVVDRTLQTG